MRPSLVLALPLALSACGARTELLFDSDSGSLPTGTGGTGATETALATTTTAAVYTSSTTAIEVEPGTGTEPATSTETGVEVIGPADCEVVAERYDQSCAVDSDCTLVVSGDLCIPGCQCPSWPISVAAIPQFNAAVAMAQASSRDISQPACSCPVVIGPCCRQSLCTTNCSAASSDTLPACTMAGGTCVFIPPGTTGASSECETTFVPTATSVCAYADEVCCLPNFGR